MNADDVRQALAKIERLCRDGERAHGAEDDLHQAVLQSIADGTCANPAECARLALTSRDIKFSRWYA